MDPCEKAENIRIVVKYFSGENSVLPMDLARLCLEFSGNLRVGVKSLVFITFNVPAFRGKLHKKIKIRDFRSDLN